MPSRTEPKGPANVQRPTPNAERHKLDVERWTLGVRHAPWFIAGLIILGLSLGESTIARAAGDLRADFAHPSAQWKSRPLWFWNAPLDKARTTEIMERSVASGYYGFGILPTKEIGVPFMSPAYLDQYRHTVDTAARLGLKMCLYDEFWFPSGSAGGLLAQEHPEALSQRLDKVETNLLGPQLVTLDAPTGELMAAVAMDNRTFKRIDLTDRVKDGRLAWSVPAGSWKVMMFVCVRDGSGGLVDYLNPEAVKKFVQLTYQKYYDTFPEHFGKTIDRAFYDEPTMHWVEGGRAWTPSFNARFKRKYGRSPALLYPALWWNIGPDTASARNQLFGFRAELYANGFIKTLADWCASKKVVLTGHQDQEEVANPVCLCGDLIKAFQHQPMPGLDEIFRYGRGSRMYKVVSSAAVNYGRQLVMTECYGGIDRMPVATLYKEAMDQFAKGVNVMIPHAVWYDPVHIIFPPELSYRTEPYASALPAYNEYVGRAQRLLQSGRPVVDIAVLYPIHDLQAATYFAGPDKPYDGVITPPWTDYMTIGEQLSLELRQDFTYLHPETLDTRCRVVGATLHLSQPETFQDYRVLILPGMQVISAANLVRIKRFYDHGGQVIATTCLPAQSAQPGQDAQVGAAIRHIFGPTAAAAAGGVPRYPQMRASSAKHEFSAGEGVAQAFDGKADTRWASLTGQTNDQWLEVDFGVPRRFGKVRLSENPAVAVSHRIEAWDGAGWKVCATGQRIGKETTHTFASVTASRVRLMLSVGSGDTAYLSEFEVYDGENVNLAKPATIPASNRLATVNPNRAGGRAWFLEQPTTAALEEVLRAALPTPDLAWGERPTVTGGYLSCLHKVLPGRRNVYFFANSSETAIRVPVRLRGRQVLERWDPHSGTISECPAKSTFQPGHDFTEVLLELPPVHSVFLVSWLGGTVRE